MDLGTEHYKSLRHTVKMRTDTWTDAMSIRERCGGSFVDILASRPGVDAADLARGLAEAAQIEYVELDALTGVDPKLLDDLDRRQASQYLFLPLSWVPGSDASETVVAVTDPFDLDILDAVDAAVGGELRLVVSTAREISGLQNRVFAEERVDNAAHGLRRTDPSNSAAHVLTSGQAMCGAALLPALVVFIVGAPVATVLVVNFCTLVLYAASSIFRVRLILRATDPDRPLPYTASPPLEDDSELPLYSIIVPMYHEAAMVPELVRSLREIDYPTHRLDILLVCEEDDPDTLAAVADASLSSQFRLLVVPDAAPKTKPKACNYALSFARGEMVVVLDAEDRPEPDQLRRVLGVFAQAEDNVACVQARLAYWNVDTNLLTRWFTIEYTMWFDLILPGLERIDAPVPLGGTSNHFRMTLLRRLGGWDPYNVTEDADLGVRLHKLGYRTVNIDSVTLEEANSQLGNWIRQRSRWMKGNIQTWLVHNRNPRRTVSRMGWRAYLSFQLLTGMGVLGALLNPFYWTIILIWAFTQSGIIRQEFPPVVDYCAGLNLLTWNFAFVYAAACGVARRRQWSLVLYAFISPLYWALISVATWKGLAQLMTRPFFWEKTRHGLDTPLARVPAPVRTEVVSR